MKTDRDGRFQLDPDAWQGVQFLIVHPSGAVEFDPTRPQTTAGSRRSLSLVRVAGKVLWQDQPGTNERIGLSVDRGPAGLITGGPDDVMTNDNGTFDFGRVLPGVVHVSRFIAPADAPPDAKRVTLDGLDAYVTARSGDQTWVLIGGQGRTVVGRLVGRKGWEGVTFSFAPRRPRHRNPARRPYKSNSNCGPPARSGQSFSATPRSRLPMGASS